MIRSAVLLTLLLILLLPLVACSGKKEPEPMPAQTATQVAPQLEPPPQLPPPIRKVQPARSSSVKVIDPGGVEEKPKTLLEASQLAKAQKARNPSEPVAEITDENLHEYAEGAEIIIMESAPAAPPLGQNDPPSARSETENTGGLQDERYWRDGALKIRMGMRRTLDDIADLELETAALRQQFYAEEDLYIRDHQIKPAWDRALDRLSLLKQRAHRYESELSSFVDSGQQLGVRQGWLNEGWELEPTPEERTRIESFGSLDSIQPPVAENNLVKDP